MIAANAVAAIMTKVPTAAIVLKVSCDTAHPDLYLRRGGPGRAGVATNTAGPRDIRAKCAIDVHVFAASSRFEKDLLLSMERSKLLPYIVGGQVGAFRHAQQQLLLQFLMP